MTNEWTERIAELKANNTFLRDYRDRLVDRIKELEEDRDGFRNGQEQAQFLLNGVMDANANLAAYNKKLLDENIILLNERNEARRKAKSLGVVGITLDAQKGKVTL